MNKQRVYIDPSSRIFYSSYYIQGLYDVFGKNNVHFSNKYFKPLKRKTESHSYDHYMAFVVSNGNETKKYIIDFRDKRSIKESAYEWCDKYAKINFSLTFTKERFHDKIVSIPPGFGIQIWGIFETAYNCFMNFLKCNFSPLVSLKNHLSDYYRHYQRPLLQDYSNNNLDSNDEKYVFMIGTLWEHANCIEGTNLLRKQFVETCKSMDVNFEGGFFATKDHPQYEEFKDLIFSRLYKIEEYLSKTKKSLFVYNTPAVHDCHGWKLGEYIAMGKAIISSPLSNELPKELVHGEDIHFISNSDELKKAIGKLVTDDSYREKLQNNTKNYFNKYGSPKAVIQNLLNMKSEF